ncbi:hypothetical protein [Rhodococcus oryzae]|uniref:hypothetical protein n=1 Tax=Rhodococcus oryzae TaxID=2571143 RepID=UPI0037A9F8A8
MKRVHFSSLAPLLVAALALGGVAIGSPASAAPILPAPGGDTAIGVTDLSLVDRDREDPWAPGTRRELAVTVTYPAASTSRGPDSGRTATWMRPWPRAGGARCRWCSTPPGSTFPGRSQPGPRSTSPAAGTW